MLTGLGYLSTYKICYRDREMLSVLYLASPYSFKILVQHTFPAYLGWRQF